MNGIKEMQLDHPHVAIRARGPYPIHRNIKGGTDKPIIDYLYRGVNRTVVTLAKKMHIETLCFVSSFKLYRCKLHSF